MTRPMPGPPEHVLETRDHGGNPDEFCWVCYYTHLPDHLASPPKHLTDAECAAEYWREQAEWWAGTHTKGPTAEDVDIRRAVTWERFATHQHANQETPNE